MLVVARAVMTLGRSAGRGGLGGSGGSRGGAITEPLLNSRHADDTGGRRVSNLARRQVYFPERHLLRDFLQPVDILARLT